MEVETVMAGHCRLEKTLCKQIHEKVNKLKNKIRKKVFIKFNCIAGRF